MPSKADIWLQKAKEQLNAQDHSGLVPFAVSMLTAIYGPKSVQVEALNRRIEQCYKNQGFLTAENLRGEQAYNAIRTAVIELESGLLGSIRGQITGEVLTDLVLMGKAVLVEKTGNSKNVSAVLIAAAFEDTIRRMGVLAGVTSRPKLEEVIKALKDADILKGGEPAVAQSFLKFRNDSLHADWANVEESQVQSCIAFLESLLLKHFS